MIYTFPRLYEERGNIFKLSDLDTASPHGYILTVATQVVSSRTKQGLSISKFKAFDESGETIYSKVSKTLSVTTLPTPVAEETNTASANSLLDLYENLLHLK